MFETGKNMRPPMTELDKPTGVFPGVMDSPLPMGVVAKPKPQPRVKTKTKLKTKVKHKPVK